MKRTSHVDNIDVKKANIVFHDIESGIFERVHPEGSSIYERSKVAKSIAFMTKDSNIRDLCVDVGCGTGFVTSFELPIYSTVVAIDISRRMLQVVRKRYAHFASLNPIVSDAEYLPLRSEIADLVSVSSVLHHLPKPFNSIREISRIPKDNGFLYLTREPNLSRFSHFFRFLDRAILKKLLGLLKFIRPLTFQPQFSKLKTLTKELGHTRVDVHSGFHISQLTESLPSKHFEIASAYSYYWIFPNFGEGLLQQLLAKSNFLIEKIPLSGKFGRYISIITRKTRAIDLLGFSSKADPSDTHNDCYGRNYSTMYQNCVY